jgi:hypothetical protein
MTEQLAEKLWVNVTSSGLGEKKAKGRGSIGMRKTVEGLIEFSIGRGKSGYYWDGAPLVTAWATMSLPKAHEMAMAILYLVGGNIPCQGEGLTLIKHAINMSVDIDFKVDLCTLLNKKVALKAEIMAAVEKKLNDLSIEGLEKELQPK